MSTAMALKEIERLKKMINRKNEEIKEHEEMVKMWEKIMNPEKTEEGGKK